MNVQIVDKKATEYAETMNSAYANDHAGFVAGATWAYASVAFPVTVEDAERFFREMTGIEGNINSVNFESPSEFYKMMTAFCATHVPNFYSPIPLEGRNMN